MTKKTSCLVLAWLIGVSVVFSYAHSVDTTPLQLFHQSIEWIGTNPWGPVLFLVFFCTRAVTLVPALVLSVAAGFSFGSTWGLFWAHLGGMLAALIFYALGYWLGLKEGLAGWWDRSISQLRSQGVVSVVIMRWCFLPYDPVSYLGGALKVRLGPFLLATFVGNLPGTSSCVLLGSSMHGQMDGNVHLNWSFLVACWVVLLLMVGLGRRLRRRVVPILTDI